MKRLLTIVLTLAVLVPFVGCAQKVPEDIAKVFPGAKKVTVAKGWTEVYGKRNALLGYVAYSKPASNGIRGYAGETPLMVTFDAQKRITSVKLLQNSETPGYVNHVVSSGFFNRWNGLTISEAKKKEVDAVAGATYTSEGVKKSLKACLGQIGAK